MRGTVTANANGQKPRMMLGRACPLCRNTSSRPHRLRAGRASAHDETRPIGARRVRAGLLFVQQKSKNTLFSGASAVINRPKKRLDIKSCGPGTRCWCQVDGGLASPTGPDKTIQSVDDGDKTNSSPGRARSKPFKPLRREGRTVSAEPVVTPPVHFFRTGDRGCGERPVFPAPSALQRSTRRKHTPGAGAPRAGGAVSAI